MDGEERSGPSDRKLYDAGRDRSRRWNRKRSRLPSGLRVALTWSPLKYAVRCSNWVKSSTERSDRFERGYFFEPTVLANVADGLLYAGTELGVFVSFATCAIASTCRTPGITGCPGK